MVFCIRQKTKENSLIRIGDIHLVYIMEDSEGLIINRNKFHDRLKFEFNQYLEELSDSENGILRENFRRKMDFICRINQNTNKQDETTLYLAYCSNMSEEQLKKREINFNFYDIGCIKNMQFLMNKKSTDGSVKANITKKVVKLFGEYCIR